MLIITCNIQILCYNTDVLKTVMYTIDLCNTVNSHH